MNLLMMMLLIIWTAGAAVMAWGMWTVEFIEDLKDHDDEL